MTGRGPRHVALVVTAVLAGCLGLGPHSDRSRLFTLTPLPTPADAPSVGRPPHPPLGLGPIVLPAYLERAGLARRVTSNEIVRSDRDRWAEPLRDAFARTLAQNIATVLGPPGVVLHPWPPANRPELAVGVEVLRFEPTDGDAVLVARWSVRRVADGTVLTGRESQLVEPVGRGDTGAAVAALSRTLGALGREIGAAVRGVGPGGGAPSTP